MNSKGPIEISVIFATRNRERLLESTLTSLERQEVNGIRWEVIVADNGSSDNTRTVLDRARKRLPLTTLYEAQPGKARCLNLALEIARGELLVFTDDDVQLSTGWLSELLGAARRWPDSGIFCGPIHPRFAAEAPAWLRRHRFAAASFSIFEPASDEGPLRPGLLPFGPNFAVRARSMVELRFCTKIGPSGSDYAMGGETELLQRLVEKGERVVYVPSAPVHHFVGEHQLEIGWLLKRAYRLGRGLARLRPDRTSVRINGVPWYLWCRVPLAGLRYLLTRFRKGAARLNGGLVFFMSRGEWHEYRLLSRESDRDE